MRLNLKDVYWNLIKEGKKTVEGRARSSKHDYSKLAKGDLIEFVNSKGQTIQCKVVYVRHYKTLREFFRNEGLEQVLPNVRDYKEGEKVYYSLPGYERRIKENGIYAIKIELL